MGLPSEAPPGAPTRAPTTRARTGPAEEVTLPHLRTSDGHASSVGQAPPLHRR